MFHSFVNIKMIGVEDDTLCDFLEWDYISGNVIDLPEVGKKTVLLISNVSGY